VNENEISKNDIVLDAPLKEPKKKRKNEKPLKHYFCKECKWYDKSSEREFHRRVGKRDEQGKRTEIFEIRAICLNPKASSHNHLVMAANSERQCQVWEKAT
jgi:hypothetical protein